MSAPTTPQPSKPTSTPTARGWRGAAWIAGGRGTGARAAAWRDIAALAALTAACAAFFAPVLFGGYWLPRGGGDLASFLYPMYRFAAGRLAAGELPLWNPHLYAGAPLLADNQSGLLYPPLRLLYALAPAFDYRDLQWVVIGHTWLAGAAMYACLRLWRRRGAGGGGFAPAPALLGALAWMLNDVFITHLGNLNFNAAAGWLPLALLGLCRADGAGRGSDRRLATFASTLVRRGAWVALAAVALALGALAGHAQATWLGAAAVVWFAIGRAALGRRAGPLVDVAVAGALALALAAPALLPALALRPHTVRAAYDDATAVQYSLPPRALVGLVAPWWYGRGAAAFRGDWDRVEVGYVGLAPLGLAVVAVGAAWRRRRRGDRGSGGEGGGPTRDDRVAASAAGDVAIFAALAAVSLLVALGPATPVHGWLIAPLDLPFRAPARYLLVTDLALAWLAAAGAQWAVAAAGRRRWRAADAVGPLLALATAIDLVALGAGVEIDPSDPTANTVRPPAAAWLSEQGASFGAGAKGLPWRIDVATGAWPPGAAQLWRLYSLGGVYNPSQLGTYSFSMDGLEHRGSRLYNRFGVGWCVTDKGAAPSDRGDWTLAFTDDPAVDVWRNDAVVPRIRLLADAIVHADDAAAFAAVRDPMEVRSAIHLVAADLARDPAAEDAVRFVEDDPGIFHPIVPGRISVVAYDPDRVVIDLDIWDGDRAFVAISDIWHPDWRATVDGQPAPLLRADFTFRAVAVDGGRRRIVMTYEPAGWRRGQALGLAAAQAVAAWWTVAAWLAVVRRCGGAATSEATPT